MLEHARCLSMPLKHAEACLSALEHAIFPFSSMLKHAIVECLSMLEHAPAVTHPHQHSQFNYGKHDCNPYHDYSGTIDFEEFCHLWNYITQWVELFKSLDRDRSGLLERVELQQACYLKRFKN